MNKIKYFVKFVKKKEHAESFASGKLYMNTPHNFVNPIEQNLSKGQADVFEGSIGCKAMIYKNDDFYVFCMSYVGEENIINNRIAFSKKIISDFNIEKGYAVLVGYDDFIKQLKTLNTNGYAYSYGIVNYTLKISKPNIDMFRNNVDNLFVKNKNYSHQREYRIVVHQKAKPKFEEYKDGELTIPCLMGYECKSFEYSSEKDKFKIIEIESLEKDNEYFYIDLNNC